ncbi:hypothetical protein LIER_00776 [Lithospermum erythrorhizon]|uniref:Uncharacterized protein n=1 Tax=Lithospermum erythrorhizon TaxID=34254 RepID=A0AAV3NN28_LITER
MVGQYYNENDIEYENDAAFFRESDLFDDDLDKEIRVENIAVQQKEAEEIKEIGRQFQMEPDSEKYYDETCSKPRRKGSYARHEVEFKFRKTTSYRKSSSNDATNNVLSESDVSDGIASIASSSNEKEVGRKQRKKLICEVTPFNNTFLASAIEGKFRVLPEITLAIIQVFVDEMFHIKISPNRGKRTKEKH